jgi:uncharacterized membrane protein
MDDKTRKFNETCFPNSGHTKPQRIIDYENEPLTRTEYIQSLVHLYRGELQRALEWRTRLDTTTNWAIISTVGILTFSFSNPQFAQETLITGMYANLMFLFHESRRFRFFDVWRSRVRMIEENFYGPILRRDLHSPISNWGEHVAQDLLHPKFKISRLQAMKARLRRNYGYIFIFLFLAWLGRAVVFPNPGSSTYESVFAAGNLHWLIPVTLVAALYIFLICLLIFTPRVAPAEESYWPDPEHLGEEVPSLDV